MNTLTKNLSLTGVALAMCAFGTVAVAHAATVEVEMKTRASDGTVMAFDPAVVHIKPGDSVHFVAADIGHDVASIDNMMPAGTKPFVGTMSHDLTVKFDKAGLYAYECKPHYVMGMVGLVVVGKPTNETAVKKAIAQPTIPAMAKKRFAALLDEVDSAKTASH